MRTPCGEVDLVARAGTLLACVEVKTRSVVALDFPQDGRFRPGKRFTVERALRQRRAAAALARAIGHRGPTEVVLCEVWLERASRRARVRLHRRASGAPGD